MVLLPPGMVRTVKDKGTTYELAFRGPAPRDLQRTVLFRPFGPLMKVASEQVDTSKIVVNVVLSLTQRVDTFRSFLQNFRLVDFKGRSRTRWPDPQFHSLDGCDSHAFVLSWPRRGWQPDVGGQPGLFLQGLVRRPLE